MHLFHTVLILLFGMLRPEYAPAALPEHLPRVVTRILVEESDETGNRLHTYDKPEQMDDLLTWLRLSKPGDAVKIDPDSFRSGQYRITLELSDGTDTRYRQVHRDYIQKNDGPWQRILAENDLLFPPQGHTMDMP
jgi:hypothetical protein